MAKNLPTPRGIPERQERIGSPTNLARPKNIARRKQAPTKPAVSGIDFDEITKQKNPDEFRAKLRQIVQSTPYISLSDLFVNVNRGGRALLAKLLDQIETEARQGQGVRTWRLKMVVNPDGSKPKPGQTISWVRQRHNRLDYGKGRKIGTDIASDMKRRGEGFLLTEEAEVELDKDCCFDVTYQDAADLLSKHGIYYLTFDPDGKREDDTPVTLMNKRISKTGTHNWRFVEIPPGFFKKKRKPRQPNQLPDRESDSPAGEVNANE